MWMSVATVVSYRRALRDVLFKTDAPFSERSIFKSQLEVALYLVTVWPWDSNSTKDLLIRANTEQLCLCACCSDSGRAWRHLHVGHQSAANKSTACYCKSPSVVHLLFRAADVVLVVCFLCPKINKSHERMKLKINDPTNDGCAWHKAWYI